MGQLKLTSVIGLASIQDYGRFGVRQYGIPQSGAMDKNAMQYANSMVGNAISTPVIEFALGTITLQAEEDLQLGLVYTDLENGSRGVTNMAKGDTLTLKPSQNKRYGYIAIRGRIKAQEDFGSVSTYPFAELGGLNGKSLKKGDVIEVDNHKVERSDTWLPHSDTNLVRIRRGPEWHLLRSLPTHHRFTISPDSNRMGIRLNEKIEIESYDMHSSAVVPGTIQLPPSGEPIVLMNDCQTTGGYPRIAQVVEEDLGKLAQMPVGSELRLKLTE